ncbi:MAG: hypothetical protein AAF518_09075 [Spirochaetota bacterium]
MQLEVNVEESELPFVQQEDREWLSLLVDNILQEVETHQKYPKKRRKRVRTLKAASPQAQKSVVRRRRKKQEDIRLQELPFVF